MVKHCNYLTISIRICINPTDYFRDILMLESLTKSFILQEHRTQHWYLSDRPHAVHSVSFQIHIAYLSAILGQYILSW